MQCQGRIREAHDSFSVHRLHAKGESAMRQVGVLGYIARLPWRPITIKARQQIAIAHLPRSTQAQTREGYRHTTAASADLHVWPEWRRAVVDSNLFDGNARGNRGWNALPRFHDCNTAARRKSRLARDYAVAMEKARASA